MHVAIAALTTRGSVRGRGKQGKVSLRKVVISSSSWHAAIFRAKGQPHLVGLTVSEFILKMSSIHPFSKLLPSSKMFKSQINTVSRDTYILKT